MLQAAGDLGLDDEPGPAVGVVGVVRLDLLERDLAVELGVLGDEDLAHPAPGMGPEDAEPAVEPGVGRQEARQEPVNPVLDLVAQLGGQRPALDQEVADRPRRVGLAAGQGLDQRPMGHQALARRDEPEGEVAIDRFVAASHPEDPSGRRRPHSDRGEDRGRRPRSHKLAIMIEG